MVLDLIPPPASGSNLEQWPVINPDGRNRDYEQTRKETVDRDFDPDACFDRDTDFMITKVNWLAANDLVDSYRDKLLNAAMPNQFGSSWMRSEMERVGLVNRREGIAFSEFFAIWQCCLISTGRVAEMSKLEKQTVAKTGRTTGWTIQRSTRESFRHTATFNTESARVLRELIFEQPWKMEK